MTIDPCLPFVPAIRVGTQVRVQPGLSRPIERWYGLHEAAHVAIASPDYGWLARYGRAAVLADEADAIRLGMEWAAPSWELIERLEAGEALEELAIAYGLTVEHLTEAAEAAYRDWRRTIAC